MLKIVIPKVVVTSLIFKKAQMMELLNLQIKAKIVQKPTLIASAPGRLSGQLCGVMQRKGVPRAPAALPFTSVMRM